MTSVLGCAHDDVQAFFGVALKAPLRSSAVPSRPSVNEHRANGASVPSTRYVEQPAPRDVGVPVDPSGDCHDV